MPRNMEVKMESHLNKNKSIKLVGLDFDNTLYDGVTSLKSLFPWFDRLNREGIKLGLVTGRTYDSLRKLFEGDGYLWGEPFPDFAICYESRILNPSGLALPGCEVWNRARDADVERAHDLLEKELAAWKRELESEGYALRFAYLDKSYGLYLEFETPEQSISAFEKLSARADDSHRLQFSRNNRGLSVHARNRSKGPALSHLLRAWGIPQEQTLVIGDSLNDLCMMNGDYHYLVATVANADPVIRAAVEKKKGIISEHPCGKGVMDIFGKLFD